MSAAITIKGIRLGDTTLKHDEKNGALIVETNYSLISSADKVLAKQDVGGYNGLTVQPSPETVKAAGEFLRRYKADIEMILGIEST